MPLLLLQRQMVLLPTWQGWLILLSLAAAPPVLWVLFGEGFLSATRRAKANVLIVEGWAGDKADSACAREFEEGGYEVVIATGGLTNARWSDRRFSYADMAARSLMRSGIPQEKVLVAPAREARSQRTYESAMAVRQALETRGMTDSNVNVFTVGSHAARSRLVFQKVLGDDIDVGVIGWKMPEETGTPWWSSSERVKDFLTETVGFVYEAVLNSGRSSKNPESSSKSQ